MSARAFLLRPSLWFAALIGLLLYAAIGAVAWFVNDRDPDQASADAPVQVRAILVNADLSEADLSRVDLSGSDLTGADMTGANLTDAQLQHVDMTAATLTNADLRGACLLKSDFKAADMEGVLLDGADLRGAALSQVAVFESGDTPHVIIDEETSLPPDWDPLQLPPESSNCIPAD